MSRSEGDKAYADAEKKLKGSFMGLGKDPDAAVESFKRACNNYKVAGCCAIPYLLLKTVALTLCLSIVRFLAGYQ